MNFRPLTSRLPLQKKNCAPSTDELVYREQVIRENEQKLQGIVQGSPIPQFVIDKDHRVVGWKRALKEYSGVSAKEVMGTTHAWKAFYDRERPVLSGLLVENDPEKIREFYRRENQKIKIRRGRVRSD